MKETLVLMEPQVAMVPLELRASEGRQERPASPEHPGQPAHLAPLVPPAKMAAEEIRALKAPWVHLVLLVPADCRAHKVPGETRVRQERLERGASRDTEDSPAFRDSPAHRVLQVTRVSQAALVHLVPEVFLAQPALQERMETTASPAPSVLQVLAVALAKLALRVLLVQPVSQVPLAHPAQASTSPPLLASARPIRPQIPCATTAATRPCPS